MNSINLLPPELKAKRLEAKKNASLVSVCIVVVFVFAILGIIAASVKSTIQTRVDSFANRALTNKGRTANEKTLIENALFINDRKQESASLESKKIIWSTALFALASNAPSDVQFETLNCDSSKTPNFTLKANTTNETAIIKFKETLEDSDSFKNVNFKNSSRMQAGADQPEKIGFTLEFDLKTSSKDKKSGV